MSIPENKKDTALKVIRDTFLLFGHDTSNLSDRELENRIADASKAFAKCGNTTAEVAEAFNKLSQLRLDAWKN